MNPASPNAQDIRDEEHLRLLAIFHFVLGGLEHFFALLPVIHLITGIAMIAFAAVNNDHETLPLMFVGAVFIAFASIFIVAGLTLGGLTIYSGLCIHKRRRQTLSMVVAGLSCVWIQFGTTVGVFTFIVLQCDSVRRRYLE